MKFTKKNIFKPVVGLGLSVILMASSCTKNLPELNKNPNALTELDALGVNYIFSASQYYCIMAGADGEPGAYQVFQSLFTDQRAQYFSCVQTAFPSDRNEMVGNWLNGSWSQFFNGQKQLDIVLKNTAEGAKFENLSLNAIAKVWKCYTYQLYVDAYGPIPYKNAMSQQDQFDFDTEKDIYTDFFKTLKEACEVLNTADAASSIGVADVIYSGDTKKWLKFANTLRLRMAMRISNVDPIWAQQEAEAAAVNGGFLSSSDDNAFLKVNNNTPNPLSAISSWGEFRMSAAMQSLLQGYTDPRMSKYFMPAKSSGKFKGTRNGLSIAQMQTAGNNADDNSNIAESIGFNNKGVAPYPLFTAAEANFLLAEAKLKGWNVGGSSAKDYYEAGIKSSMTQWGVDVNSAVDYISSTKTPVALDDEFQTPAISDIPVAFSNNPDKQLEQVITQKWLALYPTSPEAWSEFRRTGYPKLYPRLNNVNTDASVDPNSVHRLTYPPIVFNNNVQGYNSGVKLLGANGDKVSSKVWWDVKSH